jgi:hypothetical protein
MKRLERPRETMTNGSVEGESDYAKAFLKEVRELIEGALDQDPP